MVAFRDERLYVANDSQQLIVAEVYRPDQRGEELSN